MIIRNQTKIINALGRPGSTPTSTSAANISIASSDSRKKKYRVEETVEPVIINFKKKI